MTQNLIALIEDKYQLHPNKSDSNLDILITCADGNYHDLGVRLLNVWLRQENFSSLALFPGLPVDSMVAAVRTFKPRILGLSVSLSEQLVEVEKIQKALKQEFSDECPKLVIGGQAIRSSSSPSLTQADFVFTGNNWEDFRAFVQDLSFAKNQKQAA